MNKHLYLPVLIVTGFLLADAAKAANECRILVRYNSGAFTLEKSRYVYINKNQTKIINQSNLVYIKSLKDNKVKLFIQNPLGQTVTITLAKNKRDPALINYVGAHTLKKAQCLAASGSQSASTPQQLINNLKDSSVPVYQIATKLASIFNKSKSQIAKLLKNASYTGRQVASALKKAFNATQAQVAIALKNAGYTPSQIALALKSVFNAPPQRIAQTLKDLGFNMGIIAKVLKEVHNASASVTARAIKRVFNISIAGAETLAMALKLAGYKLKQVAKALKVELRLTAKMAAKILKKVFRASRAQVKFAMEYAGYSATQITGALEEAFGKTREILHNAIRGT